MEIHIYSESFKNEINCIDKWSALPNAHDNNAIKIQFSILITDMIVCVMTEAETLGFGQRHVFLQRKLIVVYVDCSKTTGLLIRNSKQCDSKHMTSTLSKPDECVLLCWYHIRFLTDTKYDIEYSKEMALHWNGICDRPARSDGSEGCGMRW